MQKIIHYLLLVPANDLNYNSPQINFTEHQPSRSLQGCQVCVFPAELGSFYHAATSSLAFFFNSPIVIHTWQPGLA